MLHTLTESGGAPFYFGEEEELLSALAEQQRLCEDLRRLAEGVSFVTAELGGGENPLLLRLLSDAEEIVRDCRRALAESEQLLGALEEEKNDISELYGRALG